MSIKTTYIGNLQTKIEHLQSNSYITTDADYKEIKNSFSSNELFIGSVSSCILTVMEATAKKNNFTIGEVKALSNRIMKENPKSISSITIDIFFKNSNFSEEQRKILYDAANNCPVVLSLNPDIEKIINFNY